MIKDVPITDTMMFVSLDIVNLYTNIPIEQTINITADNLISQNKLSNTEITEFIDLLTFCLKFNYFKFNEQTYVQK